MIQNILIVAIVACCASSTNAQSVWTGTTPFHYDSALVSRTISVNLPSGWTARQKSDALINAALGATSVDDLTKAFDDKPPTAFLGFALRFDQLVGSGNADNFYYSSTVSWSPVVSKADCDEYNNNRRDGAGALREGHGFCYEVVPRLSDDIAKLQDENVALRKENVTWRATTLEATLSQIEQIPANIAAQESLRKALAPMIVDELLKEPTLLRKLLDAQVLAPLVVDAILKDPVLRKHFFEGLMAMKK
jgi:hypothetical protein